MAGPSCTKSQLVDVVTTRILDRLIEQDNGWYSPCWCWTGGVNGKGYGTVSIDGANYYVHRVVFVVFVAALPAGYFVCHACDVRTCCNPEHLFKGTPLDNHMDMKTKGRAWIYGKPPAPLLCHTT